jgi:hypothetical protein
VNGSGGVETVEGLGSMFGVDVNGDVTDHGGK